MPCAVELLLHRGFRGVIQLLGVGEAHRQERHDVDAEDRVFVLVQRDQDFAHLGLAGRDRALDLGRLEQRRAGMDGDLQLAAGRVRDVLGEGREVFAVRIVGRIGRREDSIWSARPPASAASDKAVAAKARIGSGTWDTPLWLD